MPTELINGGQLFYQSDGAENTVVLTHGSWGDGFGWVLTVPELGRHYRVVTWDRRGHSRSEAGKEPGSQADDVADLAALIELVSDGPVHAVGNSYGSVITLNLMTTRPDLVRSVAVHEPAALPLLATSDDPAAQSLSASLWHELDEVRSLLESGQHRDAAAYFVNHVAFGPGAWEQMPEEPKASMVGNASTFLDELGDPTYGTVDLAALAKSDIPLLVTVGTESPENLRMIVREIATKVPRARVETIQGAGHVPHFTHPAEWVAALTDFYHSIAS